MKILYCAFVRLPTEKAHGVQIMKTCEAFVEEGVSVELLIPNRKTHIVEDPFEYYETKKSFSLIKVPIPDFVKWGRVGFAFSALWFSEVIKCKKVFWHADIIYSRDAFILLQYILLGRKLVYEGHTRPTFISIIVAKLSYRLVVISEGLRDAYIKKGIPKHKIIVAHDAVNVKDFYKKIDPTEARGRLSIPEGRPVALYVGKVDQEKGVDTFAKASEYTNSIQFVVVGDGPSKEGLKESYSKVLFLPRTSYKDLPQVLSAGDILVIPNSAKNSNSAIYTSPLKAFAYMAAQKPIVASDVPALKYIFGEKDVFFKADDPKDLARVLESSIFESTIQYKIPTWNDRASTILNGISI